MRPLWGRSEERVWNKAGRQADSRKCGFGGRGTGAYPGRRGQRAGSNARLGVSCSRHGLHLICSSNEWFTFPIADPACTGGWPGGAEVGGGVQGSLRSPRRGHWTSCACALVLGSLEAHRCGRTVCSSRRPPGGSALCCGQVKVMLILSFWKTACLGPSPEPSSALLPKLCGSKAPAVLHPYVHGPASGPGLRCLPVSRPPGAAAWWVSPGGDAGTLHV